VFGTNISATNKDYAYVLQCRTYADMAGEEVAKKYQNLIYLSGSASAEFFADIALCPFEAVKVRKLRRYAVIAVGFLGQCARTDLFPRPVTGVHGLISIWLQHLRSCASCKPSKRTWRWMHPQHAKPAGAQSVRVKSLAATNSHALFALLAFHVCPCA
jgi:hypothetical protein